MSFRYHPEQERLFASIATGRPYVAATDIMEPTPQALLAWDSWQRRHRAACAECTKSDHDGWDALEGNRSRRIPMCLVACTRFLDEVGANTLNALDYATRRRVASLLRDKQQAPHVQARGRADESRPQDKESQIAMTDAERELDLRVRMIRVELSSLRSRISLAMRRMREDISETERSLDRGDVMLSQSSSTTTETYFKEVGRLAGFQAALELTGFGHLNKEPVE